MRAFVWDLIRGGHYGQRPRVPRKKAEHTGAPTDAAAYMKKALANPEPSTHGGKADMTIAPRMFGNDLKRTSGLIRTARRAVCHFSLAARSQSARLFSRGLRSTRFAQLDGAVFPTW